MADVTYDLSACCCGGPTPGDSCTNCATGTSPLNMTVSGGTCTYFDGGPSINAQSADPCVWGVFPTSGSNARIQITQAFGGDYFLSVEFGGLFDSCVYKLDLGASKPDCSAFVDLEVPWISGSGSGSVFVTSGP